MTTVVEGLWAEWHKLWQEQADLQTQIVQLEVRLMRLAMISVAEADPAVEEFHLDANYEYDDEGGYFWASSFKVDGKTGDLPVDAWELAEPLREIATEAATEIVFGSKWEGVLTVDEVRAALENEPANAGQKGEA